MASLFSLWVGIIQVVGGDKYQDSGKEAELQELTPKVSQNMDWSFNDGYQGTEASK